MSVFIRTNRREEKAGKKPHIPVASLENEIWKQVPKFESYYQVSNLGRVKSLYRFFIAAHGEGYPVREKIVKEELTKRGYLRVTLSVSTEKLKKRVLLHRLVAQVFIPNPDNKPVVNHKNLNKQDNSINNLEWATQQENIDHYWDSSEERKSRRRIAKVKKGPSKGEDRWNAKLKIKEVLCIYKSTKTQKWLSKKYGMSKGAIYGIKSGKTWNWLTQKVKC